MFRVFALSKPDIKCVVVIVLLVAVVAPQFVRVHGVKIGCVCGVGDRRDIGGTLLPEVTGEVNAFEKRVLLDFVCAVFAEAVFMSAAQFDDEV